jgi:hypothetical protein
LSPISSNQFVNKSVILAGRCIPKVNCNALHKKLAK